ncbi:MAG: serine hydrolase domain-containing protein [Paracoccaceae bacterium]
MRITPFALSLLLFTPAYLHAQSNEQTEKILAAWRTWAAKHNVETAISIGHNGTILASGSQGRNPNKAYPLASLSKAITGVCVLRITQENGIAFDTPLSALQPEFDKVNIDIPAKLRDRTLASLLTMTSGLNPDRTQSEMNRTYRIGDTRNIGFSKTALNSKGLGGTPGDFFYNNGNYALLGALLEALTDTDNVTACRDRVFPKGHRSTVAFDSDWMAFAAFGGWASSTTDYTAFLMDAFKPGGDIAANLTTLPNYAAPSGWFYGLGTHFRLRQPQNVFWHAGALCKVSGEDVGTYFAYYPNGYAVTVSYNKCAVGDIGIELDTVLFNGANN